MGLYDEGWGWNPRKYLPHVIVLVLLGVLVFLLLPPSVEVKLSLSREPVPPGDGSILWVEIKNNASTPLSGVVVTVKSDGDLVAGVRQFLPPIPPGGYVVVKVPLFASPEATPGTQLLRVFVSYPGRTEVFLKKVMVG
ncbi:MAG: hypothetical protein GXO00_00780 [Candidatus Diapherotrites archaeon]|nr:hypothetical protein [Candidatus Diapherotrites archaeon]